MIRIRYSKPYFAVNFPKQTRQCWVVFRKDSGAQSPPLELIFLWLGFLKPLQYIIQWKIQCSFLFNYPNLKFKPKQNTQKISHKYIKCRFQGNVTMVVQFEQWMSQFGWKHQASFSVINQHNCLRLFVHYLSLLARQTYRPESGIELNEIGILISLVIWGTS